MVYMVRITHSRSHATLSSLSQSLTRDRVGTTLSPLRLGGVRLLPCRSCSALHLPERMSRLRLRVEAIGVGHGWVEMERIRGTN